MHPLLGKDRTWLPGLDPSIARLFDWFDDIYQLHARVNSALQNCRSAQYPIVLHVAETLRGFVPKLEVYQPYIVRLDGVVEQIETMMEDPADELGEFFRIQSANEECNGLSFASFLWLPLTRLGRYLKFFNVCWLLLLFLGFKTNIVALALLAIMECDTQFTCRSSFHIFSPSFIHYGYTCLTRGQTPGR